MRIHSTSGTTGAPTYIPLTASDLDNWITGSARSYAASGLDHRACASSRPTTPGRSRPAPRWRPSTASAPATSRSATGNTERVLIAIERLQPDAVVATPSYAAYLVEWAREHGVDLPGHP